jgi:hypothetical protein
MNIAKLFDALCQIAMLAAISWLAVRWFIHAATRGQSFIRGVIAGGVLGSVFAGTVALVFQLLHPDDPTAGSVGIMVIATFPIGLIIGAVVGLLRSPTGKT